jgi:hypothetical protein
VHEREEELGAICVHVIHDWVTEHISTQPR